MPRDELMLEVGAEITEFQNATDAVDDAVSQLLGVNRTDMRCFGILFQRGPMTAGRLADAAGLSPGAMTTVLDRLERAGWVRRVRDEQDRRRIVIQATEEARRKAEELYGPIAEEGFAEMRHASTKELRVIRDFLRSGRELQERHAARIRALAPPSDVRTVVRNATREMKAAAKEAKAEVKAAAKQAARSVTGRSPQT